MKAFFNGIELEGTAEEIASIISNLNTSTVTKNIHPKQKATNKNLIVNPQETTKVLDQMSYAFPDVDKFIKALYRYKPDRFSPLGRAPYTVTLLATGESFTIKRLIQLSNSNTSTVSGAIRRAADAGCVIEVTKTSKNFSRNTKVKMISLGTPEQAEQVRNSLVPSKDPRKSQYRMQYKSKSQNNNQEAVNRNSPPIVKIGNNN